MIDAFYHKQNKIKVLAVSMVKVFLVLKYLFPNFEEKSCFLISRFTLFETSFY